MANPLFLLGNATVVLPHVTSVSSYNTYHSQGGEHVWTLSVFITGTDLPNTWTGSEAGVAAMRDALAAALDAWWSR